MRFREFKVLLESKSNVVVIGDSIAVGIGGDAPYAKGGISTTEVLNRVNQFVQSGNAKGATVILSSGASNSAKVNYEGGGGQSSNFGPIAQQVKALKAAGASVKLVGTGSGKSKWFPATKFTGGKRYQVDLTGVNQQLESIASATGAKFLGPLEEFDPRMTPESGGDGIHPFNGYKALYSAGTKGAGASLVAPGEKTPVEKTPGGDKAASTVLRVPTGRIGTEVADVQKALIALGFDLSKHGVDGVRGPETSSAVKQFQKEAGLTVDGDPGPDTIAALNKVIAEKGITIAKSTEADVKAKVYGDEALPPVEYSSVTKGKIGKLLDLISKPESGGHYDIMMGGKRVPKILTMTLAELLQFQREYKSQGHETAAAGRYQFMPATLKGVARSLGLDLNKATFDPQTQDDLTIQLLRQKGLDRWLDGKMSDDAFMDRLSQVWAGLPSPSKGGASWYQGVGSNKAGISVAAVQNTLNDIKSA